MHYRWGCQMVQALWNPMWQYGTYVGPSNPVPEYLPKEMNHMSTQRLKCQHPWQHYSDNKDLETNALQLLNE